MPRLSDDEKRAKLRQRIERLQQRVRRIDKRQKLQSRSERSHRMIVHGTLAETHALKNPTSEYAKTHVRLLKEYARIEDRHLFAHVFAALLPEAEAEALLAEAAPSPAPPPDNADAFDDAAE